MIEQGNALSRNPNICACCSSLADGIYEDDRALLHSGRAEPTPICTELFSPEPNLQNWVRD
jgi:hypothetical protein